MSEPPIIASGIGIVVTQHNSYAHVNLRGDPLQAHFAAAVRQVLGAPLPVQANILRWLAATRARTNGWRLLMARKRMSS